VSPSPNRSPVSNDTYRDNFDRIFRKPKAPHLPDGTDESPKVTPTEAGFTVVPAQYLAGWNAALDAACLALAGTEDYPHQNEGLISAVMLLRK
jgi:hypothetical protein